MLAAQLPVRLCQQALSRERQRPSWGAVPTQFVKVRLYEHIFPLISALFAPRTEYTNNAARYYELLEENYVNIKTKALTTEQYKDIITTMKSGFCGCRPNERAATALVLEGNLGLRISDILKLRPRDIISDGDRYRLEIVEQKTGKARVFTVPLVLQQYIENYCLRCGIGRNDLIFPITERAVQKQLSRVCDYLNYEGISTHSFRKWYATEIYKANGYDIALVQRLLQHSSAATTQRYIGIEPQRIEQAIEGHAQLF